MLHTQQVQSIRLHGLVHTFSLSDNSFNGGMNEEQGERKKEQKEGTTFFFPKRILSKKTLQNGRKKSKGFLLNLRTFIQS